MAAIRSTDFPSLLTEDIQSIFNEVAKTKVAENVGMQVFGVKAEELEVHNHLVLHGLTGVTKVTEGADFPETTIQEGDSISFTQAQFGVNIPVTKKLRIFEAKKGNIEKIVRSISEDAFDKIDQAFADVLLRGFATTVYTDVLGNSVTPVGPNALQLFYTAHTSTAGSTTFSNRITYGATANPPLSREAIVGAYVQAKKYKDPNGRLRPVNLDTLLVPPSLLDEAYRHIYSDKISGGSENDTNMLLKGKFKIKEWDRLETRGDGTDTSAYWFMYDSKNIEESLIALFKQRPMIYPPETFSPNLTWNYMLDFLFTYGFGYQAYIYGSNGTSS